MSLFRVLHISDIHIGDTYKASKDIALRIISDIAHNGLSKINTVAVTGDIFNGPSGNSDELINESVIFFETLLQEININQPNSPISKEDFIFIPGNHDIVYTENKDKQLSKYISFLEKFYSIIPDYYNDDYSVYKVYENEKIAFVGFNSCELEHKKVFSEDYIESFLTKIDDKALSQHSINKDSLLKVMKQQTECEYQVYGHIAMSQLTSMQRETAKHNDFNIISLFHHHFYLFPEILKEYSDVGVIRNHSEVTQKLKYMNVKTVLHGHKHFDLERPFTLDDYYENSDSIIDIFSSGSLASTRKDKHTFNIIDFYNKDSPIKLTQRKFIYNGEQLEIKERQVPPKNSAAKIINLLDLLEANSPYDYKSYIECTEKLFTVNNDCNKIIEWVSNALTGFNETYKMLSTSSESILSILYAVHFRTVMYTSFISKEDTHASEAKKILRDFYSKHLKEANMQVAEDDLHKLFSQKGMTKLTSTCDALISKCCNKSIQTNLAFIMVGIFFSDLYLILTKYADDFKETIKHKVNIKIEENKFHENVPAPRIIVQSDADRRSVSIQLRCNEATAHKMAVLFVKEFDLLINKFEDYFKLVGLKLYYILPKIETNDSTGSLDNYNFEAYIPTLLPLLTGDNIYPSKEVFARELIQNSLDAIAVREEKDTKPFSKTIVIEIGFDENNKRYFKISDNGTGMDRYKIERYFTSIGRSFYSGDEYEDLQIEYKPISSFGIGFLSSFMVCKEIDVKTKYYTDKQEDLKLHIPNYDGCFFIERDNNLHIGTELKLYLNTELTDEEIFEYIKYNMLDIKYDINFIFKDKKGIKKTNKIKKFNIRQSTKSNKPLFFIPLTENNKVLNIDYTTEVLTNTFSEKYKYGILIVNRKKKERYDSYMFILNSGVLVDNATVKSLFNLDRGRNSKLSYLSEYTYNDIYMNFPPNWIQLDVSREKITGFTKEIESINDKNPSDTINLRIATALYSQINDLISYSKAQKKEDSLPVIALYEIINFAIRLCDKNKESTIYENLTSLQFRGKIAFTDTGLTLNIVSKGEDDKFVPVEYKSDGSHSAKKKFIDKLRFSTNKFGKKEFLHHNNKFYPRDILYRLNKLVHYTLYEENIKREVNSYFRDLFFDLNLQWEDDMDSLHTLLFAFSLLLILRPDKKGDERSQDFFEIMILIENILMNKFTINDVVQGNCSISITYDELYGMFSSSEDVKE